MKSVQGGLSSLCVLSLRSSFDGSSDHPSKASPDISACRFLGRLQLHPCTSFVNKNSQKVSVPRQFFHRKRRTA